MSNHAFKKDISGPNSTNLSNQDIPTYGTIKKKSITRLKKKLEVYVYRQLLEYNPETFEKNYVGNKKLRSEIEGKSYNGKSDKRSCCTN